MVNFTLMLILGAECDGEDMHRGIWVLFCSDEEESVYGCLFVSHKLRLVSDVSVWEFFGR